MKLTPPIIQIFYIVHHYNAYQAAIYPGLGVHQWQYNPTLAAASNYVNSANSARDAWGRVANSSPELQAWKCVFRPKYSILKDRRPNRLDTYLRANGHTECPILDLAHFDLEQRCLLLDRHLHRGVPMPTRGCGHIEMQYRCPEV